MKKQVKNNNAASYDDKTQKKLKEHQRKYVLSVTTKVK